jgi:Ca2+/H+ antiporter, TMEM165/GDT1 family
MLIPDKMDEEDAAQPPRFSACGTTLGMMLANAPVVWLGECIARLIPLRIVHIVSVCVFLGLGLFALLSWG